FKIHESGRVSAGPRQTVDESEGDRIADDWKYDWHGAGRLKQRPHGPAAMGQDDIRRERDQVRRVSVNIGACVRHRSGYAGRNGRVLGNGSADGQGCETTFSGAPAHAEAFYGLQAGQ